jgi:CRP-like cAMP-binding protein
MNYVPILSTVDILGDLSAEHIEKILSICTEIEFESNAQIFEENSPSKEFYIIVKGNVDIQLDPDMIHGKGDQHESQTIVTLRTGQSFGEVALVDQGVRSASAKATDTGCTLLQIDRTNFMNLLNTDLNMGFIVMQNLAADLCFKIRNTNLLVREALLV